MVTSRREPGVRYAGGSACVVYGSDTIYDRNDVLLRPVLAVPCTTRIAGLSITVSYAAGPRARPVACDHHGEFVAHDVGRAPDAGTAGPPHARPHKEIPEALALHQDGGLVLAVRGVGRHERLRSVFPFTAFFMRLGVKRGPKPAAHPLRSRLGELATQDWRFVSPPQVRQLQSEIDAGGFSPARRTPRECPPISHRT